MRCKENHQPEDYVECDDCGDKGCRMCEEDWETDFDEGVIRCPICSVQNKLKTKEINNG